MSEQAAEGTTGEQASTGEQESSKTFDADYVGKLRAEAAKYRTEAKANADAAKRLAEIEDANRSETEKAIAAARKETEDAVRGEVRRERVLDRIEVLAAKDFADAEDARLRFGARADEFVGKDGSVDADLIRTALEQLLKDKPHLAAVKPDGRPKGDADQGARDTARVDTAPGLARLRNAYAASSKTP
jgi:hypothetical protein